MQSPFKFLDSYTRDDREIFFGRDREIEEMYQKVFEGKILLVYGISGTGKTSLINCGLANKFEESDWLPVFVRRGRNILESLVGELRKQAISPLAPPWRDTPPGGRQSVPPSYSGGDQSTVKEITPKQMVKSIRSLYLDHFKPVYLVFDQFEELFIFGDREERRQFMQIVKAVADSDVQCRMIFSIREEYLAGVTEFEELLPDFMGNRMRVEKMTRQHALHVIEGPCRVHGIGLEEGFAEALLEKLNPSSNEVELTYLQVILDKIHRIAQSEKPAGSAGLSFTLALLEKTGNVSDILGSFLDEQISRLDNPGEGLAVLKSFVSVKGTKRQMSPGEVSEYARTLGKPVEEADLKEMLQNFIQLRILRDRDQNDRYELRHDALAMKIYEKITLVEKELLEIRHLIENAYNSWEKRGVLLSADDLDYIAPYESRLYLSRELDGLLEKSKRSLARARRRKKVIAFAAMAALLLVFAGFTWWAMVERKVATENFIRARANNFLFLSQKVAETDPTAALRLAEYAMSLDPTSRDIYENLNNIYYNNNFYRIFAGHDGGIYSASFSPDGKYILIGSGDQTARLWDLQGNELQVFREHNEGISSVAFSPDGKFILTGSWDETARLWDLQGNQLQVFGGHTDWVLSVAFSPDGKFILTGSGDQTTRLWQVKEPYEVFQEKDAYEKLSVAQKIQYGILQFREVKKLTEEENIFEAARYYLNNSGLVGLEQRDEYLNNALLLFGKLHRNQSRADYILGALQLYNTLDEVAPSEKYKKESEKLFDRLLSINDPGELQKGAGFFFTHARNSTDRETRIKYYSPCILLYEEILARFPETDVEDQLLTACNNLSLDLLFTGEFEKALDYARKGLTIRDDNIITTKVALALIYNNRIDEAIEIVKKYKEVEVLGMNFKEYILGKMAELEEAGVIHPEHERVTELIKDL